MPNTTNPNNASGFTDEQFVRSLYKTVFNKDTPDMEGLNWWLNDLNNGQSREQVAHNFMQHPDWKAVTPTQFWTAQDGFTLGPTLDKMWQNSHNGDHIPADVNNHMNTMMLNAVSLESVAVAFAESMVVGVNPHPQWWMF